MLQQAPGWYPDPQDPAFERYWFGQQWSASHIRPRRPVAVGTPGPGWVPGPAARRAGFGKGCVLSAAIIAALGVVVVVVVVLAGSNASNTLKRNLTSGNLGGAAPAARYKLGDTAKTGGFTVTVYALKDPFETTGIDVAAPAGRHYLTVDVQVNNPGSTAEAFSSLIGFHLLDSANRQYDETVVADLSPSAPEGPIPAGESIRGYVAFQVPDGTTGLRFRVQGNITAAGAVWTLT
jgi:hypothetical protein